MVDLQSILAGHRPKKRFVDEEQSEIQAPIDRPTSSEIPDVFFDHLLTHYKLNRIEIMVIMYIYRHIWCRPNLFKIHGISQILSHTEMAKSLHVSLDDIYHALRKLEELTFLNTVRSGQYFIRKYFTKEFDDHFGQTYDDFDV